MMCGHWSPPPLLFLELRPLQLYFSRGLPSYEKASQGKVFISQASSSSLFFAEGKKKKRRIAEQLGFASVYVRILGGGRKAASLSFRFVDNPPFPSFWYSAPVLPPPIACKRPNQHHLFHVLACSRCYTYQWRSTAVASSSF